MSTTAAVRATRPAPAATTLPVPKLQVETLPNGAKIVLHERPGASTMSFRIANLAGSWSEPVGKEGLAHLTEHLWFQGTPTRKGASIDRALNQMGGNFNAYTELGETVLIGDVNNVDAKRAASLLSDMYRHPSSDPYRVEKERRAVQHEIRMKTSDAASLVQRQMYSLIHGDDTAGNDGWGTVASVDAIKPADIRGWAKQHIVGRNTVAFVSGDPKHAPLDALRAQLSKLPKGRSVQEPAGDKYQPGAKALIAPIADDPQANIALALPTDAAATPAGTLAMSMLLDKLSSKMRGQRWMTYGVMANDVYGAPLSVSTELHPRDIKTGVGDLARTIRNFAASIDTKDVAAAKQQRTKLMQQRLADPEWAAQAAFGAALSPETEAPDPNKAIAALRSVTVAEARAAAREIAASLKDVKIAAWGNVEGALPKIKAGLKAANVKVKLEEVPFDASAWNQANDLKPDPRYRDRHAGGGHSAGGHAGHDHAGHDHAGR